MYLHVYLQACVFVCLQFGNKNKSTELLAISRYYSTSPRCITLIDDAYYNERYAKRTGAVWQHVNNVTGKKGDVEQGMMHCTEFIWLGLQGCAAGWVA